MVPIYCLGDDDGEKCKHWLGHLFSDELPGNKSSSSSTSARALSRICSIRSRRFNVAAVLEGKEEGRKAGVGERRVDDDNSKRKLVLC